MMTGLGAVDLATPEEVPVRTLLLVLTAAAVSLTAIGAAVPGTAATVAAPSVMTGVVASPGPGVGEITVRWSSKGKNTTRYVLDTGLTTFSRTDPRLPDRGRRPTTVAVSGSKRSLTLTRAQVAAAGAPVGSGFHLYVRLYAQHRTSAGTRTTYSPKLLAVSPKPRPVGRGTALTVVSFNVRNAKDSGGNPWERRVAEVAKEIVAAKPGVAGLQELSPSRVAGGQRQTESLLAAVRAAGGQRYRLVRTAPYVPAGTTLGQGARILYDASAYKPIMACPETRADRSWSNACTIRLPLLRGEGETERRAAAVAHLQNRRTGARLWVVSAHLDSRTSSNHARDVAYDQLRAAQITTIARTLNRVNPRREPVVFTGDINSWQARPAGSRPNDTLYAQGYYDTVATARPANLRYSTFNGYAATVAANPLGYHARVDVIMVKNAPGSTGYANRVTVSDRSRPSDHNLQRATVVLPTR